MEFSYTIRRLFPFSTLPHRTEVDDEPEGLHRLILTWNSWSLHIVVTLVKNRRCYVFHGTRLLVWREWRTTSSEMKYLEVIECFYSLIKNRREERVFRADLLFISGAVIDDPPPVIASRNQSSTHFNSLKWIKKNPLIVGMFHVYWITIRHWYGNWSFYYSLSIKYLNDMF